jgi:hypothetical protein
MIEKQLRDLAGERVECEILDLIPLNYKRTSYLELFDRERVHYAQEIVRKKKPNVLVSGNDVAISATIIKACNLLRVPSLVIQHGILTEKKTRDVLDSLRWRNYLPWRVVSSMSKLSMISKFTLSMGWRTRTLEWGLGGATKYAVMGEFYKRLLVSHGVPPHKVVITGYPLFDLVPNRISIYDEQATFEKIGLEKDKGLVLFTAQAFVEDGVWPASYRRFLVRSIIDSVERLGLQLIIKVHPRENIEEYEKLSGCTKSTVMVLKHYDLHELLLASDVVITVSSTTGLWSLVYNKPLIVVTCFPVPYYNIFEEVGLRVDRMEDLTKVLEQVFEDQNIKSVLSKKREIFLREHAYKLDGQASRRIAKLILKMVEGKV